MVNIPFIFLHLFFFEGAVEGVSEEASEVGDRLFDSA